MSLFELLPRSYQYDGEGNIHKGMEGLFKVFDRLLGSLDDQNLPDVRPFGARLDALQTLFHPSFLPFKSDSSGTTSTIEKKFSSHFPVGTEEFVSWMSGWVDLAMREDWGIDRKRIVLGKIVPLYRKRGTKEGLQELLNLFVLGSVEVVETNSDTFMVGSTVGVDTTIGGKPYNFKVIVHPGGIQGKSGDGKISIKDLYRVRRMVGLVVEREKPAHTTFKVDIILPGWQLGEKGKSTVGETTLIGKYVKN